MVKKTKKGVVYEESFTLNSITLSCSESNFKTITEYFGERLTQTHSVGSGVARYEGYATQDLSTFVGQSSRLSTFIIEFVGESGLKEFNSFRTKFLIKPDSDPIVRLSRVICQIGTPTTAKTAGEVGGMFANVIESQVKSKSKVQIVKEQLRFGGTSGDTQIRCSGFFSGSYLKGIFTTFKIQGKSSNQLFALILQNTETKVESLVAFHLRKQLGAYTMTDFLDNIRNSLLKVEGASTMVEEVIAKKAKLSKEGAYVHRTLTAVFNKLINSETSLETQTLILEWSAKVVQSKLQIIEADEFNKKLAATFNPVQSPEKTPSDQGKSTVNKETSSSDLDKSSTSKEESGGTSAKAAGVDKKK